MKLTLTYKSVFGRDSYYPDDANGKLIGRLGGFKTFTVEQVNLMRKEGWELEIRGYVPDQARLGREPLGWELKAEVNRILDDGMIERASQGKLKHQRRK